MNIPGVSNIDSNANTPIYGDQSLGQDDFMRLLLEELSHQDPLNPMDSKEFTVQMTQFASLEGINDVNKNLNDLLSSQQSMQNATITNMIGKTVTVDGNSTHLNGMASMNYDLSGEAASVKIIVRDGTGRVVRSEDIGAQTAGNNQYIWDGRDDLGKQLPDGSYSFEVEAINSEGEFVGSSSTSSGYVTGVSFENGLTYLVLDGTRNVYLSEIKSIQE